MSSPNLVAEIYQKFCNKRVLGTREPCTCKYVTLLQSFHRGTLNIHWHIAQNFQPTFSISVLFRRLFWTAIFRRFSKVAIATSNFLKGFCHKYMVLQYPKLTKIYATRFAELIQFWQEEKQNFLKKWNLVFRWTKISYFVFIYIFQLVLVLISQFQIHNLELARWFLLTLKQ